MVGEVDPGRVGGAHGIVVGDGVLVGDVVEERN